MNSFHSPIKQVFCHKHANKGKTFLSTSATLVAAIKPMEEHDGEVD